MIEHTVVLECKVLGGFELRDAAHRRIPYQGKLAVPEDEYKKSPRLQDAVKNGWLLLKKNPSRRLNLTFTKQPPSPSRTLPLPQDARPPVVDREELKAELMSELLPTLMQAASQTIAKSMERVLDSRPQDTSIADLIKKMEENQEKQAQMIKETLQQVVVTPASGNTPTVSTRDDDVEIFIPTSFKELKGNLNFEENESSSVDDAMAALKALKGKKS